ncbi:MAG: type II toxin-antitoxin system RelE/ParE family toxin [Oscillospiraceae bacterium]|nr:type II toxin-antitoxin system RelE/ParE family toxin [Oscillospiraceae bacterium]
MDTEYKLIFTAESRNEIKKIYNYISKELYAEGAAKELMEKIEESVNNLKHFPFMHQKVDKYGGVNKEYRRVVVKNFIIIYDIEKDNKTVYIDHIFYGGSNYSNKI